MSAPPTLPASTTPSTGAEIPIEAAVAKLQEVMRGKPPPWLRKAMGLPPDAASPIDDEE